MNYKKLTIFHTQLLKLKNYTYFQHYQGVTGWILLIEHYSWQRNNKNFSQFKSSNKNILYFFQR